MKKWCDMYNVIEILKEGETKEIFKEIMARSFSVSVTDTKPLLQEIYRDHQAELNKNQNQTNKNIDMTYLNYKFENRKILKIP